MPRIEREPARARKALVEGEPRQLAVRQLIGVIEQMPAQRNTCSSWIIPVIRDCDGVSARGGHMADSAGEWLITLKRLQRIQQETEADVARKTQEHQATADAWASRVVRPAFATLQQHFNQSGGTRHLAVYPDMPEERPSPRQARGIEAF